MSLRQEPPGPGVPAAIPPRQVPAEVDTSCGNRMKQPEVPTAWQGPPCQEDWEAELEDLEDPPPFILNVGTNDLLLPYESTHKQEPRWRSCRAPCGRHGAAGTGGTTNGSSWTRAVPILPPGLGGPRCQGGPCPLGRCCRGTMFPGTPRSPRRAGSSAQRIGMRGCPGLSWRNTFPAHPPRTQIPSPRGAGASPHRRAETFPHALPAGGKPSESLPAPAVSCVLRTVPITALQHLPADFAQRVDPAGHETRHVSTPSHGSRSPGGRLPSPPGMGRGDQRRRETQSSRRDPSLPPRSGSRYRLGAGSCPRAGTSRAWPRLLGQPGSAG
ncbi:gametocyte-specific factor 1 isoform X2 [Phalacrocorax carbo]|uniref:gametocyte-specific factor 1 isoform X2 n=1 Tax=Phalacrocorax carbo TaxID=9209 RepID=UPI00311A0305